MLSTPASSRNRAPVFAKLHHHTARSQQFDQVPQRREPFEHSYFLHTPSFLAVLQNKLVYVSVLHSDASGATDNREYAAKSLTPARYEATQADHLAATL